jgi:hypothetical protein
MFIKARVKKKEGIKLKRNSKCMFFHITIPIIYHINHYTQERVVRWLEKV